MNDNTVVMCVCLAATVSLLLVYPLIVYGVTWIAGRAWYAGKLSAIRSAFHNTRMRRSKRWSERKDKSSGISREE